MAGFVVILEPVKGITEGSNLSGDSPQIFQDLTFGVENLDCLGVGIVSGREGLRDCGSVFTVKN